MKSIVTGFATAVALWSAQAVAAEVKVLSAGAVEPGLHKAADLFKAKTGHEVKIQFNTAPQIAQRLKDNYVADVLIAPPGALEGFVKDGKVAAEGRVPVGKVGAGVTVRTSATPPNIATTDAFKQSVLSAESLVYNTASTGLYLEKLFEKLGIAEQIKAKSHRYPNGEAVMEHVIKGKGNEIGFGAITEIKLFESKGLKLVGPLPADVQNYTNYSGAILNTTTSPDLGKQFLIFLATPEAKQAFVSAGVE
ncbi:substrate-binding domain-containing protein [Leptospira sp. severe_002]|uniref:substrate-binding domain-containing protein n=1 Tax=Leptospira sp. severe_002 TaxID=2838237 RepID=UPI001E3C854B|nr:substrate-binding domain-containing protein [Leptospira sp. severe_002]